MFGDGIAAQVIPVGVVATVVMDVISVLRARLSGVRGLDYALLGRWMLHMWSGRWFHNNIAATEQRGGERPFGWLLHYVIGVIWAAPAGWMVQAGASVVAAAFVVGVGSVVAPWFVMQPAFGMGIAGRKLPEPWTARSRSLQTHLTFALGLWVGLRVI